MKRQFSLSIMLLTCSIAVGGNLYDGKYDRPSYFPDYQIPSQWPNNMTYAVQAVTLWGDKMENYEVAVYDQNDQLRAIGRSQSKADQLCVLTILGEDGDTFRFEIICGDFENPSILKVSETCAFVSNAIVGRDTPFLLTQSPTELNIGDVVRFTSHLRSGGYLPDIDGNGTADQADRTAIINKILSNQ